MATHSSILAWEIPWTEEPCGLQFTLSDYTTTTTTLLLLDAQSCLSKPPGKSHLLFTLPNSAIVCPRLV